MLVLSRKADEKIIIEMGGLMVVVMPVEIRGDKVRLGIEAPSEITIHREEVYNAIRLMNPTKQEPPKEQPETEGPSDATDAEQYPAT